MARLSRKEKDEVYLAAWGSQMRKTVVFELVGQHASESQKPACIF